MAWVRGEDASTLYKQGADALSNNDFAGATQYFDKIIANYPNTPTIDNIRLMAGFAYFRAGDYTSAISRLTKEIAPDAKLEIRPVALLYTGLAELSQAQKLPTKYAAGQMFAKAAATFTDLVKAIAANPTPDNNLMREDTIYYRVLAEYQRNDYEDAEKDLLELLQDYPGSLKRPDYNLLLGSFYAAQASQAVNDKKSTADIKALAGKSLAAFSQVSYDPNARVQANDANLQKAEVLYMIALDNGTDGYQKALDAFRLVRRKDDMVKLQQDRLDALKAQAQQRVFNTPASLVNSFGLLIEREEGHLKQLQDGPDPIIQALIRIAECYNSMDQGDEARTVLHRLAAARSSLTPDQQQDVDFDVLYSYVLSGRTDKADAALTDYLAKYPGDKQRARGISYEMAGDLLKAKNYQGALAQAQRSLKDFPEGLYAADAVELEGEALNGLGRPKEAEKVLDDYINRHPSSPTANRMLLSKGRSETAQGNFTAALADFGKVKDNAAAGDLQPIAAAACIQTLQSLQQYDKVVNEAKAFAGKYPDDQNLPSVLLLGAIAMDLKHDPGAVAALQDVAKKYPQAAASPFALYYVINIYQRAGQISKMIQAAADLRAAYPTAFPILSQVAAAVSDAEIKAKKFDDALAEYQPLLVPAAPPEIASLAQNKIGDIWYADAKAMGFYQSLQQQAARDEADKRLGSAETAYVKTLKNFPDQLPAVGDAFDGLVKCLLLRRTWGLIQDDGLEGALDQLTANLSTPEMKARVELAKAGLVFVRKDGASRYAAALDRIQTVVDANPGLALTRQEAGQYGELLIAAKQYAKALEVFNALLAHAAATDRLSQADADYGLGAAYLAQGDAATAKPYFLHIEAWHLHFLDAQYGIALADEQSNDPGDNATAKQIYASLMQAPQAGAMLQAEALLGYGRVLEKTGYAVNPTSKGPNDVAVHYYQQVDVLFGPAVPELSAEGLFLAGQAYAKAGNTAQAQAMYKKLTDPKSPYAKTAPDWVAKARAELSKLGP